MILKIAWKHIRCRPVSGILTILAISLVLTLLGSFWALRENLSQVQTGQSSTSSVIHVFMKTGVLNEEVKRIEGLLQSSPMIAQARVVSPEEAFKEFQNEFGETLSKALSEDSLPVMLTASFKPQLSVDRASVLKLLDTVRSQRSVLEVDAGETFTPNSNAANQESRILNWAFVLFALVFVIVALLISHIIRLAFEGNREEIETLKILGASKTWIFWPMLIEALFYGLLSIGLTIVALNLSIQTLLPTFANYLLPKNFEFFSLSFRSWLQISGVALGAAVIGALFTWPLVQKPARRV